MMHETELTAQPQTQALRRHLAQPKSNAGLADLLFLEAWEWEPTGNAGVTLRIGQIRRANPALAAEIRAEITQSRALMLLQRTPYTSSQLG